MPRKIRGVIQINPEFIYFSAAKAVTRNHIQTKKHHRLILYLFYYYQSVCKTNSKLSAVLQTSVVSTTRAKTAITRWKNFDQVSCSLQYRQFKTYKKLVYQVFGGKGIKKAQIYDICKKF
jgi:hypothetical protein